MTSNNPPPLRLHEDGELFREAVNFTAATTGFLPSLIEKDYFCTVVLQHLMAAHDALVFKGGNCLAKVHAGFYRRSEDIDLVIPMPVEASRTARRRQMAPAKDVLPSLVEVVPQLEVVEPLTGANDSAQYNGVVSYPSLLATQRQTIKLEISLREPLLTPAIVGQAIRNKVTANWEKVPPLRLTPDRIPPEVEVKASLPNNLGRPSLKGPGRLDTITLNPFRKDRRLQELVFELARGLTKDIVAQGRTNLPAHVLFPRLVRLAGRFVAEKV